MTDVDHSAREQRIEALLRALHREQFGAVSVDQEDIDETEAGATLMITDKREPSMPWWLRLVIIVGLIGWVGWISAVVMYWSLGNWPWSMQ